MKRGVPGAPALLSAALALCIATVLPANLDAQEARATATRVPFPPVVDGVLDEPFWATIEPVTGFRQRDPLDGAPASEKTEVRIGFDDDSLYFGFRFFDSEPSRIRRNILHRGGRIDKDDRVIIALDTYHDRRNAYIFEVGALGTQDDALISDESMTLDDWNWDGVFTTATTVNDEGWVLEVGIPFTTIRFADTDEPVMGIAFQRSIRRKNESVYWPHIGQDYRAGIAQVSRYAPLVGLSGVRGGRHLEIKPYAIAGGQRRAGDDGYSGESDFGVDLKYALTSNLTLDLTWNTDFAQVESDNVQINLTRFDLFFPEKREFFLERAGLFQFGAPGETEVFFSRRIGLEGDITGGGRLTGQAGPISIGALALRTGDAGEDGAIGVPAAWNSVLRLQGNVGERASAGVIATSLDRGDADAGPNRVLGGDVFARFWSSSSFRAWAARVFDSGDALPDASGGAGVDSGWDRSAARASLTLQNERYVADLTRTRIGGAFDPALGFVRRPDQDAWSGELGFTPRFESSRWARRARFSVETDVISGLDGVEQSREREANAGLWLESGDGGGIEIEERTEFVDAPVSIRGRELPPGDYRFTRVSGRFGANDSRALSGYVSGGFGGFWSGDRDRIGGGITWKTGPHLTVGAELTRNRISLPVPDGDFTTTLLTFDIQGALNRKLFANALVQWDNQSKELQANIRVDWIHTPGSDLFLVIDTGYLTDDDLDPRVERWTRRTGVMKLTYLKAF